MKELNIPAPSEKQRQFLTDTHRYIGYGGARGGGKSWAVRTKAVLLCLKYPGIKVMIVRRTYPELQENHIIPLCSLLRCYMSDPAERIAEYNDTKKHLVFKNGSRILFRYCDDDRDAMRFQGTETDVLFVDEATQQSESRIDMLTACVRGVNDFPKRVYLTMNPGGEGHAWAKRLFIDRQYRNGEKAEDFNFIPSRVTDNKALMESDPGYIEQLKRLPDKLKAAWLYGSWDVYEGQYFDDFRPSPDLHLAEKCGFEPDPIKLRQECRFTHVIEPFDLNSCDRRTWRIIRSYDFGYGKPYSCAWWAVDHDGVLYRFMELYGCTEKPNEGVRQTPEQQFREIARIEREHPWLRGRQIDGVADPSIWESSRGVSIAETAARCGVYFIPGDNARVPGWMQCHYRLQFDDAGRARMYVFDTCKAFIRTVPLMQYSPRVPEDLDTTLEDHVCDEWRYTCMLDPIAPMRPLSRPGLLLDPLKK